jgi:hypothetical protein
MGNLMKIAQENIFEVSNLPADRATARVLAIVGSFLHRTCDEPVRTEKMTFQSLVGEEAVLTLLTVQRRTVVDHFGVDLEKRKMMVMLCSLEKKVKSLP